MKNLGYYNGKIGLIEEMSVPMTDRAFYFGDGVYDAVMCRNNIPYLLDEHIDRFYHNCNRLSIVVELSKSELFSTICSLVRMVEGEEKFVYFHASRGNALRAHSAMPKNGSLCIMITDQKMGDIRLKMNTILVPDIRYELCDIKTLNLLPSVLVAQRASIDGADEAIFQRNGIITEGSHSNVSIISNGKIITAPSDCHILPGVTRAHLIKEARSIGIMVEERPYTIEELLEADEVLITSSSKMLRGVATIDGEGVGGKNPELLARLQAIMMDNYLSYTSA